jgi:hypothetical protein
VPEPGEDDNPMSLQPPGRPSGWVLPPDMLRTWDPNRRLQPLAIADLLGRTLRLYARNFAALASIALAVYVPLGLLSTAVTLQITTRLQELLPAGNPGLPPFNSASTNALLASTGGVGATGRAAAAAVDTATAGEILRLYLVEFGLTMLIGLIGVIAVGALVHAAVLVCQGRRSSVSAAFRAAFGRLADLVCAELLQTLAIFGFIVIGVVALIVFLAVIHPPAGGLSGLQVILGLVAGAVLLIVTVLISTRLAFIVPAVMLEDRGPRGSLSRSWALSRGSMLRIVGGTMLTGLLVTALVFAERIAADAVAGPLENLGGFDAIARMTLDNVTSALLAPITTVFLALLYLDVRVRKEGFDLPPA